MNPQGTAVAWFREEDWPRWCEIDPDFQPDYQHWLGRAEAAMNGPLAKQQRLEKVLLDPDTFVEWSKRNGGAVNSQARSIFAAIVLSLRHSGKDEGDVVHVTPNMRS